MASHAQLKKGLKVLDVGCGTGAPACELVSRFNCTVLGITTSEVGIAEARRRAELLGCSDRASFELRDGMDNKFPDSSFDRAWVLESSHLMPAKDRLLAECSRILRPGGRLVLCDIVLRAPMPLPEVIKWRDDLLLLRDVFGQAKMEPEQVYRDLAAKAGLKVELFEDLSELTFPTFARWRENAQHHREEVMASIGEDELTKFVRSCDALERLWRAPRLGYGLLAAVKS